MRRVLVLAFAACSSPSALPPDGAPDQDQDDSAVAGGSRCADENNTLVCTHDETQVRGRTVGYQVPLGTPPPAGWPAVIFYQGSFIAGVNAFTGPHDASFGQYDLTLTVQALLDRGYAVLAPNARQNGSAYWQTNIPPYATNWAGCDDDLFITDLLAAIGAQTFGPIDTSHLHAMGISSGGYMTSRMAVSYPGTFRSLAIASASYATCGPICSIPTLPADHPPTLFLHGDNDAVVPISTMYSYRDQLVTDGRTVDTMVDANRGHEWLPGATAAIPAWFDAH